MPAFAGKDLNVRCFSNTRRHIPIGNPPVLQRHTCSSNIIVIQAEGQIAGIARHEAAKLGYCDSVAAALVHTCNSANIDQVGNLLKIHPDSVKAFYRRKVNVKGNRFCAFCAVGCDAGNVNC